MFVFHLWFPSVKTHVIAIAEDFYAAELLARKEIGMPYMVADCDVIDSFPVDALQLVYRSA